MVNSFLFLLKIKRKSFCWHRCVAREKPKEMSRKYKFYNKEGLYFVSFATVHWIDIFARHLYSDIVVDGLIYCKKNLGLELYCWCIMPSHIHLIFSAKNHNPDILLGRIKEHTSKEIVKAIKENSQESKKNGCFGCLSGQAQKVVTLKDINFGNTIISQ